VVGKGREGKDGFLFPGAAHFFFPSRLSLFGWVLLLLALLGFGMMEGPTVTG
jgi:hypothetical protein